jgi:C-terminal processing protease CtpA/Prc
VPYSSSEVEMVRGRVVLTAGLLGASALALWLNRTPEVAQDTALKADEDRAETIDAFEQEFPAGFGGIGVVLESDDEGFYVGQVIADSPAEYAGLKAGDHFLTVDGVQVPGLEFERLVGLLRGMPGSEVTVALSGADGVYTETLTRGRFVMQEPTAE